MEDVLSGGGEAAPVRLRSSKADLRQDGEPEEVTDWVRGLEGICRDLLFLPSLRVCLSPFSRLNSSQKLKQRRLVLAVALLFLLTLRLLLHLLSTILSRSSRC